MAQTVLFVCQDGETTALRFCPDPLPEALAASPTRTVGAAEAAAAGRAAVAAASASAVQLKSSLILIPAPSEQSYRYLLRPTPGLGARGCLWPDRVPATGRQRRRERRCWLSARGGCAGSGETGAAGGAGC